jgi:hypothetical protein
MPKRPVAALILFEELIGFVGQVREVQPSSWQYHSGMRQAGQEPSQFHGSSLTSRRKPFQGRLNPKVRADFIKTFW